MNFFVPGVGSFSARHVFWRGESFECGDLVPDEVLRGSILLVHSVESARAQEPRDTEAFGEMLVRPPVIEGLFVYGVVVDSAPYYERHGAAEKFCGIGC